MAVFTSGEFAMERAIWAASSSLAAPETTMVTNFEAPSPSRAICWARLASTFSSAAWNAARSPGVIFTPEAPLASTATVSLVEVSLSTERRW